MPAREFSQDRIVRSVEMVLSKRNINFLTQEAYTFIHIHCGSLAHFSLEGWKNTYRDLRDFLSFFLVRNEYSACLVDPPEFMNLTEQNKKIILAIVAVCQKYREGIESAIDEREAEVGRELGRKISSGEISLQELFRRKHEIEEMVYSPKNSIDGSDRVALKPVAEVEIASTEQT